jgi:hypothetical protein
MTPAECSGFAVRFRRAARCYGTETTPTECSGFAVRFGRAARCYGMG